MNTLMFLFIFSILSVSMSIKIPIVNEDYINILIGTPARSIKLFIDPVAPFSYININLNSTTYETNHEKKKFSNIFGNFEGEWGSDFFYLTSDQYLPLRMKFLMVQKTDSAFKVDGVIGLGYSEKIYPDCSIYANLAKLSFLFETKNVLSYDKTKKLLTIGEIPELDNFNPVTFNIYEGHEDYPASFVNITSILLKHQKGNITFLNITGHAKIGLMPVIIAPNDYLPVIEDKYNNAIKSANGTYSLKEDEKKFYSTFISSSNNSNITTEMVFGKIAYKYNHFISENDKTISNIRIGTNKKLKFWYIGIDNLNVHRADFDFSKGVVTLFSPTAYDIFNSKAYILFSFILFGLAFCIIIGVLVRSQCQKKHRYEMSNEEDDELI